MKETLICLAIALIVGLLMSRLAKILHLPAVTAYLVGGGVAGVCMALAHTSPGQHYPNVFDEQNKAYAIPAGTEYQLLYQNSDSNAFLLKEYPLDRAQLDWTTFGR